MSTTDVQVQQTVSHILDSLANREDGSVSVNGVAPKYGYMVGGVSWSMVVHPEMVDSYTVSDFLSAHRAQLSWDGFYVGWWTHENKVYFDVSVNIVDRAAALKLASENGELAIYDLDENEEIMV